MAENKKIRILSLDGGGIRGVIPATVMVYVEQKLKDFSNNPNARIADYFDVVVGTSTGGILGAYYLVPDINQPKKSRFEAKSALDLYVSRGIDIFNNSKKKNYLGIRRLFDATSYDPSALEKIFREQIGDLKFSSLVKPCLITTYNMKTGSSFFFFSLDDPNKRDFYVRDVLRSTSAAPTYFPPAIIQNLAEKNQKEGMMVNLDGGVFANNPALCAYAEVRSKKKIHFAEDLKSKDMMMLSLGTGSTPTDYLEGKADKDWGLLKWATTAPDIMMDGALDTVNYQIKKIFGVDDDKNFNDNFMRVDFPNKLKLKDKNGKYLYSSDMADASPENIKNLQKAGQITVDEANKTLVNGMGALDDFIKKLVDLG